MPGEPTVSVVRKTRPTMYFIGVTTKNSSIMKVFPLWMRELGRPDVVIEGVDLKLHDSAENYRAAVAQIKYDPLSLGALVTTHKINLLEASRDLFEFLDPYAVICGEVSSISRNGSALEGHAKDPITAGLSLDSLLGERYFGRSGGEVLCLGAGGSTTAIILHFARKPDRADRPRRMVLVNRSPGRLENIRAMVGQLATDIAFEYHCNTNPEVNDRLMAKLPPGSMVINATGMGKDLPGSPITDQGLFPEDGIAWELNYRGELKFLHQALKQHESRRLTVEDGWLYFLHGWTQVIAEVVKVSIDGPIFDRLAAIAGGICTPALAERKVAAPRKDVTFAEGQIVDFSSPIPYYFQLGSYIENRIRNKQWRPGQLLPSEQEVCERAGVSRTVVRQAMAELERKGLVSKQSGKRSSVAFPKYEGGLMQNLRGFFEDAVAKGQKPATRVLDFKVVPASSDVAGALRLREGEPVIMLNRLRFLDGQPEVLVVTYIPQQMCPGLLREDLTGRSLYELLDRVHGLRIASGFRTIEAIALDRADAKLLGVKAGSPALLLTSIGLLEDGTPLEYFIARHRGDRARFEVRLVRNP